MRDYKEIEQTIAESGFFSEYLPPCFKINKKFFMRPPQKDCDLIPPLCFSMSRHNLNDARRNIFVPEFGSYAAARAYIKQEHIIQELVEFSESSDMSFSPILGDAGDIMRHEQSYTGFETSDESISSDYMNNIVKEIIRSSGAKSILKLDISNCFSSFYMHMIPAIILGKEHAEAEYKKSISNKDDPTIHPQYTKYINLDSIIRRQNMNQTNGLLVGTLYSKIIAECILVRIDKELSDKGVCFSRYVDDYEVYIYDNDVEIITSVFEKVLKRYGFALNYEKTELLSFPYYIAQNLEQLFRNGQKEMLEDSEVMELFNTFMTLESKGTKGAIRYLLKSIEKEPINIENPDLYKAYLLTIRGNDSRSLTKVCSLLISNHESIPMSSKDVNFVITLLRFHLESEHDLEAIWLLYYLTVTGNLTDNAEIISEIINSSNELAKALLLCKGILSHDKIEMLVTTSSSWLLVYELFAQNHISEEQFCAALNIKQNLDMYQYLKGRNLHFISFE